MNWMVWLLATTTIVFLILTGFLGKEMLNKFRLHDQFTIWDGYIKKTSFYWAGDKKKGMKNIVIEADCPFSVLVGFKLEIPLLFQGTDWFGLGVSQRDRGTDRVVISTFLWKKPVEFPFLINSLNPNIHVNIIPPQFSTANLEPDVICPPHLYQRLGFYA